MHLPVKLSKLWAGSVLSVGLACTTFAYAAMDPRFELDTQALHSKPKHKEKSEKKIVRSQRLRSDEENSGSGFIYTVKPGDFLFKILMRKYNLTSDEADSVVGEISRENGINDITHLRVGQKIIIPSVSHRTNGRLKLSWPRKDSEPKVSSSEKTTQGQAFQLSSPYSEPEQDPSVIISSVWNKLLPPVKELQEPLSLKTSTFSLTLDPQRYPVFPAMDGGRIILDQKATIPPLVKSLIEEKDPKIRIVSESSADAKKVIAAMLSSAGFYSVEQNFTMEFGVDPKLIVTSDFKVEKTPESLIKQDVTLLNSGKFSLPQSLNDFLKKEGFTVYEPFSSLKPLLAPIPSRKIHQVISKSQPEVVEAILNALAISFENDRRIDVFAAENNGISLSVKAEHSFEQDGQRFIVTGFDGDPITYTLFRLLETKGYRVVILQKQDDFRAVTEKILDRLRLKTGYAQHKLWPADNQNYLLQMSGYKIDDPSVPGGSVFITNLGFDKIIRDLLSENGYSIEHR